MPLTQERDSAIGREVVQQFQQPLELRIMATEGRTSRVELMLTVTGCHDEPCRLIASI